MQTDLPFYEGPEDALRAAITALKGAKVVGLMLWPDKAADTAARQLLNCTDPSRAEKLEISQIMFILSKARDIGFHAPFFWFCGELGYEAKPVSQEKQVDRLVTVIEQASRTQADALAVLERIQRGRSA